MRRLVALYRSPAYSPSQHLQNDRAIMDAVVDELAALGWQATRTTEQDVAAGRLPAGDLYLNMCQGPAASRRLRALLAPGALCINAPDAVLACHRHRLVPLLREHGVSFPATVLLRTSGPDVERPHAPGVTTSGYPIWVKRGDVHAQSSEDVVAVAASELPATLAEFARRGIERVALQAHVPGPVVKFYGVVGRSFFHWSPASNDDGPVVADTERLHDLAEGAARALGLSVYGGDAVLPAPDRPVLIDLNDWPSFARVRAAAATAIARYAHRRAHKDAYSCSTP